MSEWQETETTREIAEALRRAHDLCVYGSYSAPDGDEFGDPDEARMMTLWALPGTDYPLLKQETRWPVGCHHERTTTNWLCVAIGSYD